MDENIKFQDFLEFIRHRLTSPWCLGQSVQQWAQHTADEAQELAEAVNILEANQCGQMEKDAESEAGDVLGNVLSTIERLETLTVGRITLESVMRSYVQKLERRKPWLWQERQHWPKTADEEHEDWLIRKGQEGRTHVGVHAIVEIHDVPGRGRIMVVTEPESGLFEPGQQITLGPDEYIIKDIERTGKQPRVGLIVKELENVSDDIRTKGSITLVGRDEAPLTVTKSTSDLRFFFGAGITVQLTTHEVQKVLPILQKMAAYQNWSSSTSVDPIELKVEDSVFKVQYTNWGDPYATGLSFELHKEDGTKVSVSLEKRYLRELLDFLEEWS